MSVQDPAGDESATLQARLELAGHHGSDGVGTASAATAPTVSDPVALLRHLEVSGHLHRDSGLGRLFHRGMVSLREDVPTDSLHVVVEGNRVAAHVDGVSPLAVRSQGPSRYSVRRAVTHNLAGMFRDLVGLLRGRQGEQRCELNCEWVSSEAKSSTPQEDQLLDPKASAWSVQMEARIAGALDEARLRLALNVVLGRHTLQRDPLEVVDCQDDRGLDAARARLQSRVLAVTESPPFHVYLARHPAGDVLMLNLNHAAGDGFAALQVLHSIARAYAADTEPEAPLDFLASQDVPVQPAAAVVSFWPRFHKRAVEWLADMLARPARLAADQPGDQPGYGFHLVELSAEETRPALDVKRSRTSTDLLLAALHRAIGDWNLQHDTPARGIGVLVAANLRPADWRKDAVGNFSVTARLSTRRRDRADSASALKAITAQTHRNKRTRTGLALIAALERAGMLALWAKQSIVVLQPLTAHHLVDTALLCDLGWLDEAPSFGPEAGETVDLWFSTPARSPLSLCLGAVTVGGRLHLTFRYPHRLFGADAARRFADCYLDHLRLVADSRS